MFANLIGIPLVFVVLYFVDKYVMEWDLVGNRFAVDALGLCLGLCVFYVVRGVDIWFDRERDNPPPLLVPVDGQTAFGEVKEFLSETGYGTFFWNFRSVDTATQRLVAVLNFTENMGLGVGPWMQAQRYMVLTVNFRAVEEQEQKPIVASNPEKVGKTAVEMQWTVDSPVNRFTVNKIQDVTTKAIKRRCGLAVEPDPAPPSPFMPPLFVIGMTVAAFWYCANLNDQYDRYKAERAQARTEAKEKVQQYRQSREEAVQVERQAEAVRKAQDEEMALRLQAAREEQRRKLQEIRDLENRVNRQSIEGGYSAPYTTP